jgi:protein kinase C substrate 80K-H
VGHIGAYVPFSYVNDGVCDYDLCCDGTEEFGGRVKCENRCASIGKEYRRLEAEKRSKMERAGKKRKTMANEARELRRRVEAKIATLKSEVAALETKKDELKRQHEKAEREEKTRVVKGGSSSGGGGKLGVLVSVAKARVTELRNTLEGVMHQRDELSGRVEELETILRKFKEEYNPNFNDEGVKAAVKAFEDYAAREAEVKDYIPDSEVLEILREDSEKSGVNWAEFENGDGGDDTDVCEYPLVFRHLRRHAADSARLAVYNLEAYLPVSLRNIIRDKMGQIRVWLIQNGVLADSSKGSSESQAVKAAREAFEAAERDLKKKNKDLTKEEEDLTKDYGPGDILRSVKDTCVSIDSGEYTYELCWLGKTSQKSKKGHGNTNMGNFERIDWEDADDEDRLDGRSLGQGRRMVMRYENGQSCWNGPRRRTDVWLGCAETEELWRVSESEKCVYKMEVGTPAACDVPEEDEGSKSGGKDEL